MKMLLLTLFSVMALSTQAFAIGAITPRPDCQIIQTDAADINHPVTYNCANPMRGGGQHASYCDRNPDARDCKACGGKES